MRPATHRSVPTASITTVNASHARSREGVSTSSYHRPVGMSESTEEPLSPFAIDTRHWRPRRQWWRPRPPGGNDRETVGCTQWAAARGGRGQETA